MPDIYDFINELRKIEIEYEDTHSNKFYVLKSYIKSLEDDRILVDPPHSKGVTHNIPDGHSIRIIISAEDGVYYGDSEVIGKKISGISGLWITYPHNSKRVQRREFLRVPLKLDVKLSITETNSKPDKKEISVNLRDISGKGLSFFSDEPLKNYYDIECEFDINDKQGQKISSKCEHIYSDQIMVDGKVKYINALAFINLENQDVERIVKECFKHHLAMRRKGLI